MAEKIEGGVVYEYATESLRQSSNYLVKLSYRDMIQLASTILDEFVLGEEGVDLNDPHVLCSSIVNAADKIRKLKERN